MSVIINGSAGVTTNTGAVYDSIQRATAQASTSGTAIDFTSIPSWVRRITVMFQGLSTNSSSNPLVRLGTGSTPTYTTSGYLGSGAAIGNANTTSAATYTTGFGISAGSSANIHHGIIVIANITGNNWVASYSGGLSNNANAICGGGSVSLADALTAIRFTTVNGTDTFDAGTINILYE